MSPDRPESPKPARPNPWAQASLALSSPTLMVAGPLAGGLLALGAIWAFGIGEPWAGRIKIAGIIVGLVAGARETLKVIRRISDASRRP